MSSDMKVNVCQTYLIRHLVLEPNVLCLEELFERLLFLTVKILESTGYMMVLKY